MLAHFCAQHSILEILILYPNNIGIVQSIKNCPKQSSKKRQREAKFSDLLIGWCWPFSLGFRTSPTLKQNRCQTFAFWWWRPLVYRTVFGPSPECRSLQYLNTNAHAYAYFHVGHCRHLVRLNLHNNREKSSAILMTSYILIPKKMGPLCPLVSAVIKMPNLTFPNRFKRRPSPVLRLSDIDQKLYFMHNPNMISLPEDKRGFFDLPARPASIN